MEEFITRSFSKYILCSIRIKLKKYAYFINFISYILMFQDQLAYSLGDKKGRNTRNGQRFYGLFEEGPWKRPGIKILSFKNIIF